jgi:hypothetical protein
MNICIDDLINMLDGMGHVQLYSYIYS